MDNTIAIYDLLRFNCYQDNDKFSLKVLIILHQILLLRGYIMNWYVLVLKYLDVFAIFIFVFLGVFIMADIRSTYYKVYLGGFMLVGDGGGVVKGPLDE